METIITQTINYGNWQQWQGVFRYYGVNRAKNIV